jgi:hypothetical protein
VAVSAITLTPKGQAKIQAAIRAATEALQIGLAREMQLLRTEVSLRAPSSEEEAVMLSEGIAANIAGGNVFSGGYVGTPDGGRFQRLGAMIPIREAIYSEPLQTRRQLDRMVAGIGSPAWINARTGFSWDTRKRGVQGPTLPFNQAYVQALENGGVWVVVPRPENRGPRGLPGSLEPEEGLLTRRMVKTLQPRRMYASTLVARSGQLRNTLRAAVQQAVRGVR